MSNHARSRAKRIVCLEGSLTLPRVQAAHAALATALKQASAVEVDCANATDVDVSFIQLLLAARRSSIDQGKSFALAAPAAGALLNALERGGFLSADENSAAADRDFWS
jgi:ABC-type transporter Mla MlaB component